MLTRKQHELLLFIHERLQSIGVPPSFDEMKEALDLKSKSGIHRLITALEERGFIRRLPNRARALEVVRLPDSMGAKASAVSAASASEAPVERQVLPFPARAASPRGVGAGDAANDSMPVPVMGRIAAGVPISAIQQNSRSIALPIEMFGQGEHYALEVKGDSMVDAGILDGDTVLIQRAETATAGEIVNIERPGNDNGPGGGSVHIVPSPYFDAVVDQRATKVAAPIGVAAAMQGRSAAGTDAARAARRRIPGRG